MSSNDDRLRDAIRRLFKPGARSAHADDSRGGEPSDTKSDRARDWQQFIESELNGMNRRLSAIETRMTLIFYLVVVMTVVTVFSDAGAAQKIVQGLSQIKP